jgi:hypothetical protein
MSDWSKPKELTFQPLFHEDHMVLDLMPNMHEIPEQFKRWNGDPYIELQKEWFYRGLEGCHILEREGIDRKKAIKHLAAIQNSFTPKHEHKVAAVAFLMSLWFSIPSEEQRKEFEARREAKRSRDEKERAAAARKKKKSQASVKGIWKPGMPLRGGL